MNTLVGKTTFSAKAFVATNTNDKGNDRRQLQTFYSKYAAESRGHR